MKLHDLAEQYGKDSNLVGLLECCVVGQVVPTLTVYLVTQHNIAEDMNVQQRLLCESQISQSGMM